MGFRFPVKSKPLKSVNGLRRVTNVLVIGATQVWQEFHDFSIRWEAENARIQVSQIY